MTKEEAIKIWHREFGDCDYAHDFTGRKIKREDYNVENQVGWVVAYMKPLSLGGEQNEDNDMIVHHITAYEKADNYPNFEVVGVKYKVGFDEKDKFYFIEKVVE